MLHNANNIPYFVHNHTIKTNRMGGPWHSRWYVYEEMKYILKTRLHITWHCLSPLVGTRTIDQNSLPLKIQFTKLYSHKWSLTEKMVESNTLNQKYVTWPWWFRRENHYERLSKFTRGKLHQFQMGNITITFFKSYINISEMRYIPPLLIVDIVWQNALTSYRRKCT